MVGKMDEREAAGCLAMILADPPASARTGAVPSFRELLRLPPGARESVLATLTLEPDLNELAEWEAADNPGGLIDG